MSDEMDWQTHNDRHLSAAITWLRSRLTAMAGLDETIEPQSASVLMPEAGEFLPALTLLSQQLELSFFEQQTLLLCAAMALDTRIASLCAQAQDDSQQPYPTFALALSLFDHPAWDVVSPDRPLRYWRLIEIHPSGVQPITTSPLRADERIVNYLKGLNYLDDRLSSLMFPINQETIERLPDSQQKSLEEILRSLQASSQRAPIVQLLGNDSISKQSVAQSVCKALNLYLYRLPADLLPTQITELETFARLWQRESRLLPLALYIDMQPLDDGEPKAERITALRHFLARSHGIIFLNPREIGLSLDRATVTIDVAKPTVIEQRQIWEAALETTSPKIPMQLASQFNLNGSTIYQIAQSTLTECDRENLDDHLWKRCLNATRPALDHLAQRLDPKATWEEIVLSDEALDLLHQIAHQVRQRSAVYDDWGFRRRMNRGLGVSALFAGESGTGKTMAAEVLANDLHLNLYRIDLSSVVSKYIGETEKNLRRLFDAAEEGGALLFFDEADALFGKRSEVKDSHDRYANIEVNYLLQRIESYQGLAILATNLKSSLDSAFLRRLRFVISFPFPSVSDRQHLWQKAFPADTPTQDLDFKHLARFNLAGGSIHTIAINAAFLAATANTPVTMTHLLAATRSEFRKLERPINEADFSWQTTADGIE